MNSLRNVQASPQYESQIAHPNNRAALLFCFMGGALLIACLSMMVISWGFPYGTPPAEGPFNLYVGTSIISGLIYCTLFGTVQNISRSNRLLVAAFVLGLAMRASMFWSLPVLEDDWYRYLWDGATVASGIDPYKYAPAVAIPPEFLKDAVSISSDEDVVFLQSLAAQNVEVHYRINYPYLTTIYPPLAQLGFGLASVIAPFELWAWRLVLLGADIVSFVLLVGALKAFGRSSLFTVFYWWNPVLIFQGFGAGHMDVLIVPFLLGAIWLARVSRPIWAISTLASAAAVKLWPILLAPAFARPYLRDPVKFLILVVVFCGLTTVLLFPQISQSLHRDAGLSAYAGGWQRFSFLFAFLHDGLSVVSSDPGLVARAVVAIAVIVIALWAAFRGPDDACDLPMALLIPITALIFLSPTGYPWYLIWLAPLIAFHPYLGFGVIMATIPLYSVRFLFGDLGIDLTWLLAAIAFGVPLLFLFRAFISRRLSYVPS